MALSQEIVLYKKVGETPLECLERLRLEQPEYKDAVLSYAGRLDPMAEGILLAIVDEANKDKEKYLNLDKEYEFEILWGIETDTYDVLGMIMNSSYTPPSDLEIQNVMKTFVGRFDQAYPAYSSKTVQGKPLHEWAREGRLSEIEIPKRSIEIKLLSFISTRNVFSKDLGEEIFRKIALVKGDFRQEEIKSSWMKELKNREDFFITKVIANVSSGTYIRSLAHELGRKLNTHAIAYSIKRTKLGNHSL